MTGQGIFDQSFWANIAADLPELESDPEGAGQLVDRFVGQYLPVLLRTGSKEGRDRAWLAFWSYVVAPATSRKPFGLSPRNADRLIEKFQRALEAYDPSPPVC